MSQGPDSNQEPNQSPKDNCAKSFTTLPLYHRFHSYPMQCLPICWIFYLNMKIWNHNLITSISIWKYWNYLWFQMCKFQLHAKFQSLSFIIDSNDKKKNCNFKISESPSGSLKRSATNHFFQLFFAVEWHILPFRVCSVLLAHLILTTV